MTIKRAPNVVTSRRTFLRNSAYAGVGSLSMFSTLMGLRQINAGVGAEGIDPDDYKALVCVFLYGGNDSANMLVPTATAPYADYVRRAHESCHSARFLPRPLGGE